MDERSVRQIAGVCHEANRQWCRSHGDDSQPSWDDAPDWQVTSVVAGVKAALAGASPRQGHEGWCEHKRADGWIHGPVKDPDSKTHPCLVPYNDLPPEQRAKNALFHAIVGALGIAE